MKLTITYNSGSKEHFEISSADYMIKDGHALIGPTRKFRVIALSLIREIEQGE